MLGFLISRQADKPKWVPQLPAEKTIHARGPGVPQISTMISSIFGTFWNLRQWNGSHFKVDFQLYKTSNYLLLPCLITAMGFFEAMPTQSVLLQLVSTAHLSHLQLAVLHTAAGPGEVHVEVHAVDTGARVVLDAQINVLLSAESENV